MKATKAVAIVLVMALVNACAAVQTELAKIPSAMETAASLPTRNAFVGTWTWTHLGTESLPTAIPSHDAKSAERCNGGRLAEAQFTSGTLIIDPDGRYTFSDRVRVTCVQGGQRRTFEAPRFTNVPGTYEIENGAIRFSWRDTFSNARAHIGGENLIYVNEFGERMTFRQTRQPAELPSAVEKPDLHLVDATLLSGTWVGSYLCAQGIARVTLRLQGSRDGQLTGTFEFGPHPENRDIASGAYRVKGTFDNQRTVRIEPLDWIRRPAGYETVGLESKLVSSNELQGQITHPDCALFMAVKQ